MENHKVIFFIEDEKSLSDTLSEFLRSSGYIVEAAYSGKEALVRLPVVRPALILLDIILPEMSGIDFLKEIQKSDSEFKNIPVIVLTNLQGDITNFEKMGLKIMGYFVKANTPLETLEKEITKILKK